MNAIFIVLACTHHEGTEPVKAFEDEADAISLAQTCNGYDATIPKCPAAVQRERGYPNTPGYWLYMESVHAWEAAHPAGREFTRCDVFKVQEIPFQPSTKKD